VSRLVVPARAASRPGTPTCWPRGATPWNPRWLKAPFLRHGALAAAGHLLGRHRWFAAAAAGGLVLRVLTMLAFPPAIWFGGDSASYLSTALRLAPGTSRLSGYGLLLLVLRPFHSFALVTAVQHLMGLAIGVITYALLRRYGLPGWGATLAALPVLFSAYQVQLEQEILPSAAFCCLVMTAAGISLCRRDSRTPRATAAAGGLLAISACFWPVGLPLLIVFLGFLVLRRAGWQVLAAAVATAVLPLAGYLAWFDHTYHRIAFSNSDGIYLWSRTMSFANCAVIKPPQGEAALCPPREGPRAAASTYIWAPDSPLDRLPGTKFSAGKNSLAMKFALRAIAAQPLGYLTAVLHDTSLAFDWNIPAHPSALMTRRYEFGYATQSWISPGAALARGHTVAADQRAYGGAASTRAVQPLAGWLVSYQRAAYLRGTLLAAVLAIGLGGIARHWRGTERRDRGGPGLYPWLAAITVLAVPVLTADYSERYVLIAVPLACLAAGLAFAGPPPAPGPPGSVRRAVAAPGAATGAGVNTATGGACTGGAGAAGAPGGFSG
jgi:hypothetical protein